MKPLQPRTEKVYGSLLARAFNGPPAAGALKPDVRTWPDSERAILRAAIRRTGLPEHVRQAVPAPRLKRTVVRGPGEDEAASYEQAAAALPKGKRALALLALAVGLRADELLTLTKLDVQRAARGAPLVARRKGGKEQELPAEHVRGLLEELLSVKAAPDSEGRQRAWQTAGEILTVSSPGAQYQALRKLVRDTGRAAGISIRPHLLRHAFATRMARDGAHISEIQRALGHAQLATTTRYVNPDLKDVAKHMRDFNR